ncbi:MAG: PQQ-binding-like beta-propeller repeat protein [Verrucomicrobia bacterium]|nr:PQQ-binding-like beta-propeller repeat protein [Verrucomicrobiota bacterium]MBT4902161.1 PQQ-binding-like beta-propeller repeat protein [Verrucomicrobiota bacterium]MBT5619449.1 PQQ-binding-like beta-propeller repeat protein [Verrucomicrobiota bacterium]MBT6103216.1 PQQ-binding-like beta-propeller repeat protein [Verrucomicrobiota bacterium]MBT6660977.1 PQQ-binding-like beta-propeller repeat protein [Verrucomicrobiota bacterium]
MKKILLTFTFAALANGAAAGDWTGFRGPLGNGVSDEVGLPVALNAKKHISWRIDLPGRGLSSPLVVGNRVFVTASAGTRQDQLQIICINAADGSVIWQRQFWAMGSTMCHNKTSIAAPTPVTDGRLLFAIFSSNDLFCLDLDGNLQWLRGMTLDYPNARNSLGMASSLVLAGGVLVAQVENDSESFTAGLDKQTGVNLWRADRPKSANWTTATVQKIGSGAEMLLLQSGDGIHAVNPKNGEVVWHYADGASTIPSSALAGGVLYVPSHGLTALELADDGRSFKQKWRSSRLRPGTASPLVHRDRVYSLNNAGVLTCGDTDSGKRLWQLRLDGPFGGSPVVADNHLYAFNEEGKAQVVDLSAPEGRIAGEMDLGEMIQCSPAVSNGALYVRSNGRIWKIARKTQL